MRLASRAFAFAVIASASLTARAARAETWEAPVGGAALPLPAGTVACPGPGTWTIEGDGHALRPPTGDDAIGRASSVSVAPAPDKCGSAEAKTIDLVALGRAPDVDPASIVLSVDDARVEIRGHNLRSSVVRWRAGGRSGDDRCVQPVTDGGVDKCVTAVGRGMPADPTAASLAVYPRGARVAPDAVFFDATGVRAGEAAFAQRPARVVISSLAPGGATIDLAGGTASRVPLAHPEAVTGAECGAADCALSGDVVVVRGLSNVTGSLAVRLHLLPRVFFQKDGALDPTPTLDVPVLPCGMSIASGEVPRDVDDSRVVVKIDARCASDAKDLRFFAQGHPVDVLDTVDSDGAAYALLRVGRVEGDDFSVTASRGAADLAVVGAARARTRALPPPRAVLELPGRGTIDFIPTNRAALVRFGNPGGLHLLPIDGVYDVARSGVITTVEGKPSAAGFVALRFGYRVDTLPSRLALADLAVLVDPVERPMHAANVPAPLGASAMGARPLVELDCAAGRTGVVVVPPGEPTSIPFEARDSCRVVLHAERLPPEDGTQELHLEVDVTRVDGTPRSEAHLSQPIMLRPGPTARYAWIRGMSGPFDRAVVRIGHNADEAHYVGATELLTGTPSVQWSVAAGTGHARIYATAAVPTGLYRVSDRDHSGILSLNLGFLGRFTWLDSEGHEGFLGLEAGVMGLGLANDVDRSGHSLSQIATVSGLGISVPIANRSLATETSLNLHAWMEYEVSRDVGGQPGSPFGFVFGPSISVGNVGTNL